MIMRLHTSIDIVVAKQSPWRFLWPSNPHGRCCSQTTLMERPSNLHEGEGLLSQAKQPPSRSSDNHGGCSTRTKQLPRRSFDPKSVHGNC